MWLLYEVIAAGNWQDVGLMKESFKDPISFYSPDDQFMKSFAKFQVLFKLSFDVNLMAVAGGNLL